MKNLKIVFFIYPVFYSAFFLFFFLTAAKGEIIDRVVAIVNKDIITLSELLKMVQTQSPEAKPILSSGNYREVLQGIINQKLIDQEASQEKINVSKKEVDQFIERFKKRNAINTAQLKEALQQQGLTWDGYREQVQEEIRRSQIISQKIHSQVSVSEKEIGEYYQNHLDKYVESPRVKIDQIFFPFTPKMTGEDKDNLALKAEEALKRIKSGEDFQGVAEEYNSTNASPFHDLGYFKKGDLMGPLDEVAFRIKIGGVSNVIKTEKGYFIIRVIDRKEAKAKELNEVRKEIVDYLLQQKREKKFQEWLEELHDKAYIEIKI